MKNESGFENTLIAIVAVLALVAGIILLLPPPPEKNSNGNNNFASEVQYVVLDQKTLTIKVGETHDLNVVVSPSTAIDKEVLYKSSNESIATVDSNGKVRAKSVGEAKITAYTKNGKQDECTVKVIKNTIPIKTIVLDKDDISLIEGESINLKVTVTPSNATEHKYTWKSSNTSVATVDSNGKVTAKKSGTALITVTSESKKMAICDVEVHSKATVKLDSSAKTVTVGDTVTLKATIASTSSETVTWTSSNASVATVDSNGKITTKAAGTAIITAKISSGASATFTLTVKAKPTPTVSSSLEIHFIASGFYDDAILIRTDKATIFMDGGRGEDKVVQYLSDLKIKTIDYVIGSHTEYDHIDAQGAVIRTFNVKHALYPNSITSCGCRCESTDVRKVVSALNSKNMKPEVQSVPSKLTIGDMTLYFLAPYKLGCNKNNNSFVFILQFGNTKFMFTGDAYSVFNDLNQMTQNAKTLGLSGFAVDVFKYPHHGNQALSTNLLDLLEAKSIIAPNYHAPDIPSKTMKDRIQSKGIKLYRQSDSSTGNILVKSDGKNITIKMNIQAKDYAR